MWILFALTASIILASRKISEKQLVGTAGNSLGWMIRLGSAFSIILLWIIFSRNTNWITDPTVWEIILIISIVIYPLYTFGYYYAVKIFHSHILACSELLHQLQILSSLIFLRDYSNSRLIYWDSKYYYMTFNITI